MVTFFFITSVFFALYLIAPGFRFPFFLFIPTVIIISVLFGETPGYLATILSAVLILYYFIAPTSAKLLSSDIFTIIMFLFVGLFTSATIGSLGRAIDILKENAALKKEVYTKTEDLHAKEELLAHSQKMEALGQLTSGIAHDFNNLLTVVLGNTRLVRKLLQREKSPDSEQVLERIADIETAAHRGADLVRRLMIFARQRPLEQAIVDVNSCICDIKDLLGRTIGETIEVKTKLNQNLWPVLIDQDQFINSLVNMAVNARDAMPNGGTLSIETRNVIVDDGEINNAGVTGGAYVQIAVSDTGIGMSDAVRAKIFEPFFTTKPMGQGTGLGLSMLYGLIKQSQGYVDVVSAIGEGSTFKIYLPRIDSKQETSRPVGKH
jgi:signal transduction histidine kinase